MGKLTGTFSSAHCGSNGCTMNTDEGVACLSLWCQQLRLHCQLAACALGLEFIPRQYNLSCVPVTSSGASCLAVSASQYAANNGWPSQVYGLPYPCVFFDDP